MFPLVDGTDCDLVWAYAALVDKVGGTHKVFGGVSKKQLKRVVERMRKEEKKWLDFKVLLRGDADQVASMVAAAGGGNEENLQVRR